MVSVCKNFYLNYSHADPVTEWQVAENIIFLYTYIIVYWLILFMFPHVHFFIWESGDIYMWRNKSN